jgi:two-component system sensor kinase FixL
MNWITISWPMLAAASLSLGLIELRIGLAHRSLARFVFSLGAILMAAFSGLELAFMRAQSVAEAAALLPWMDAVMGAVVASLTAFIWVYFGTGRKWLALAPPILFAVGICADLIPGLDMTYRSITGIRTVQTFGGASFSVLEGVSNPWNAFAYLGGLALLVFVVDASVRLWRSGGRRRALIVGGCVTLFTLTASIQSALVDLGIARIPYLFSWAFLAILVAMMSELNTDVLAATKVAAELKESERRMDLASVAAKMGMWAWDIGHDTLWATRRARMLLGLSESAALNLEHFTNALHPDDRESRRLALRGALSSTDEYEVEYRVPLADGKVRWISSRGRVERDAEGKPLIMRGVVLDITHRKQVELQAEQDRSALWHMGRVSMLGQMSASIAHQLNQPLAAILGNAEAAQQILRQEHVDLREMQEICDDIVRQDQRAAGVIRRLSALFKRREMQLERVDLHALLAETVDLIQADLMTDRIILTNKLTTGLHTIHGDRVQLQQVLLNLIMNAADAMRGVPIVLRQLMISTEATDNEIRVLVVDHGPGIAPEHLTKVFEPFWSAKPKGMGIGLAICQSIVVAHHGTLTAANNPDGGATFSIAFPTHRAA